MGLRKKTILLGLLALSLSACQGVKKELGVGRNSPDEFLVVKRAPLTLPPDYDLRPPAAQGLTPSSTAPDQAKAAVLGEAKPVAAPGAAENALLQRMGANAANPEIRSVINQENGYIALQNQTVADKLIFWNDEAPSEDKIPDSVVDPKAEAERLKKNEVEGKPANEGDVPVIEKKKGTFDKIF